ncbi:hypothetical protein Droror1_Dr00015681 [Drosera rotundifolia]
MASNMGTKSHKLKPNWRLEGPKHAITLSARCPTLVRSCQPVIVFVLYPSSSLITTSPHAFTILCRHFSKLTTPPHTHISHSKTHPAAPPPPPPALDSQTLEMNNSHMGLDHGIPNLPPHEEEEDEEEENEEDSVSEDSDDGDEEEHDDPNEEEEEDNELSITISSALHNHNQSQNHLGVNLSESGRNGDVAGYGGGGKHLARAATAGAAIGDAPSPGGGGGKAVGTPSKRMKMMAEDEDAGTPEEQAEFLNEVETFYKERALEFKAPKFYGEPLNCLKLWNAVVRLGGYDRVTAMKLWRQVGESFHPPKTCTTVSWTFRIFYEKALLEYEKHKRQIGELEFPGFTSTEPAAAENEGSGSQNAGSGRARRDAAARAMQGWHAQRLIGFGEVGEPIIKDKNLGASQKREKNLKSIGLNKLKKPSNLELGESDLHAEPTKQLLTTVVDVGPPADWVKVSVRESKDCFEVYALVPGLLREEVRVQSDPAGRIVITGQPEQLENPWGITPFRKIVNLPARINPLQTSAVVSLHGRLSVRVPFERSST